MQLSDILFQAPSPPPPIDNTNYYLVFLTAILVAITAYYAWQTKRSVVALDESTKAQFKPFIKASLSPIGPVALDLLVANIGKGSAEDGNIVFRVVEIPDSERRWVQELMLPETNQEFFIPIGKTQSEIQNEYFENNQTTIEFEWECKDILGQRHSGKKRIDVTEFIKQMNRTQSRYEESFEDRVLDAIEEISKNTKAISNGLDNIHKNMTKKDAK